jgi:hypothetical protein
MFRRHSVRFLIVFAFVCVILPSMALAVTLPQIVPGDCNDAGGCASICDLATLAQNLLNDGIFIAVFLSAILFAWAGWKMVSSSSTGNTNGVTEAKAIFWNVTIGLVLMIAAWLIVSVIMQALQSTVTWNNLCNTGSTTLSVPPSISLVS